MATIQLLMLHLLKSHVTSALQDIFAIVVLHLTVFPHLTIVQEAIIVLQAHTAQLMMERVALKVVE